MINIIGNLIAFNLKSLYSKQSNNRCCGRVLAPRQHCVKCLKKLILRFLRFLKYETRSSAGQHVRVIKPLIYFTPVKLCFKKQTTVPVVARECINLFLHLSILITFEQLMNIIYYSLEQHGFRQPLSNKIHEYSVHVNFNQKKWR